MANTVAGEQDPDAVAKFWQRFLARADLEPETEQPTMWPFGDSAELADKLLALVLDGPKRATATLFADFEADGEPVPEVGDYWMVPDGSMRPRAVLRTTDVRIGPLSSVDDQFAYDEGEGDRSRDWWLAAHTRAFTRSAGRLGIEFSDDIVTVFERFELIYSEDPPETEG